MSKYHDILGVPPTATTLQIKKAYYRLCMKLHPDVNPSPTAKKEFIAVNLAYEYLMKFGGMKVIPKRKATYTQKKKAHTKWQAKTKKTKRKATKRSEAPRYLMTTSLTAELLLNVQWIMSGIFIIGLIFGGIAISIFSNHRINNDQVGTDKWGFILSVTIGCVLFYAILFSIVLQLQPKKGKSRTSKHNSRSKT